MATGLPSSIVVEVEFTAGVWTDVSSYVVGDSIEITVGKDSPAGDIQPGTLDLELDNADGRWVPDNPLSTYYPNWVEGKRIRVVVNKGTPSGFSTGSYGTGAYSGTLTQSARFVGRITTIEPDFPVEPSQSRTRVSAVDAFGDLARAVLPSPVYAYVANEYATAGDLTTSRWWHLPLRDGYGIVDTIGDPGIVTSWYQPTTGGRAEWQSDSFLSGGSLSLTPGVGVQISRTGSAARLSTSAPYLGAFVKLEPGSSGVVLADTDKKITAVDVNGAGFYWDGVSLLEVRAYVAGAPGSAAQFTVSPGWHHIEFRYDFSGSPIAYVDGVSHSVATFTYGGGIVTIGGAITMSVRDVYGSSASNGSLGPYLMGLAQSLTTETSILSTAVNASAIDASLSWSSSVAGVTSTAVDMEGSPGLDSLAQIANAGSGIAYVAYATTDPQPITLVARTDSRPANVALTLDAEADLDGGATVERNVFDKVGTATATSAFKVATVSDADTVNTYGNSTANVAAALDDYNALAATASDLIAQTKSSKLRLSQVTFDLVTAQNDLYSNLFGLAPGERVRVTNLPSTYFGVTYMDGYVLGWTERPGVDAYTVSLRLMPADAPSEAKFDDATYGRFAWADGAATVTSGTAVGTTLTGTIVVTTPSGPCLSTAAGNWPMSFDWNGECVTVTNPPASSTSPQTLTITARGQNGTVARSHAAGEIVNVWQSARFAL